ncbi:MAG: hypothetical protein KA190_01970 [Kofleriaceae bacterium]|nr:hypothetical protein [Kofleriaceae bacterium]
MCRARRSSPLLLLVAITTTLAGGSALAAPAHDAPHGEGPAVSFADAVAEAARSPELVAIERALRDAAPATARRRRDALHPQLEVSPGWSDGPAWQLALGVGLTGGVADAAAEASRAGLAATAARVRLHQRDRRLEVGARWLASWLAHQRLRLADRELEAALELERLAGEATRLGAATRVETAAATAYRLDAAARHLELEGEAIDADLALGAALARPGPVRASAHLPPSVGAPAPAAGLPLDAASQRASATAASAAAAAALAAGRRRWELGARIEQASGAAAGYVTVGIDLGGGDRGRHAASSERIRAQAASGEAELATRRAEVEAWRRRHDLEHARQLAAARAAQVDALVAWTEALDAARAAGEVLLGDLVLARRQLATAEAEAASAAAALTWAEVEPGLASGGGGR